MTDHITRAAEVLIEHTRTTIMRCHCGWADLGKSHAEHVAQALADAGLLAPATLTRDESLHIEDRAVIPEHTIDRLPGDDFVMLVTVEGCEGEVMTGPEYEQWLIRHGAKPMTRWVSEWKTPTEGEDR